MTFLPVVQRELTVAGRQRWTYAVRCVAAGLLALVAGLLLAFVGDSGPAGRSLPRLIFNLLACLAFAGALLGGLLLTTDAITAERREGTLGLLFLTELTGLDIILGKLASCGIQGFCALLGVLPILAVPLMMGGVSWTDFECTALLLGATFLCSTGLGLWTSSRATGILSSLSLAILLLAGLCVLPMLPKWVLNQVGIFSATADALVVFSPVVGLGRSLNAGLAPGRTEAPALASAALAVSTGVAFMLAAARVLRRTGRTGLSTETRPRHPASHASLTTASPPRSGPRAGENAYGWLLRTRNRPLRGLNWIIGLVFAGAVLTLGTAVTLPTQNLAIPCFITAMFTAYACHVLFKLRTALLSSAPLAEDAAGGGLELILCTPLRPREILAGHGQAVRDATRPHLAALALLNLGLTAAITDDELAIHGSDIGPFLALFLGGMLLLWVDQACLIPRGALQAIQTRQLNRALARALLPLLLLPWIAALFIFLLASHGMNSELAFRMFLVAQVSQGIIAWILNRRARTELDQHFRTLVATGTRPVPSSELPRPQENLPPAPATPGGS